MRACEIACCLAEYIRHLGFNARAHFAGDPLVEVERLAVLSGLAVRSGARLETPCIGMSFSARGGIHRLCAGARSATACRCAQGEAYPSDKSVGINRLPNRVESATAAHDARVFTAAPIRMETVKRVDRPTTLIIDKEVPRVPQKRAAFFQRALHSADLGEKAKKERTRFAFKTPLSFALLQLIRSLVKFKTVERPRRCRRP